jgi:hypothetical protein
MASPAFPRVQIARFQGIPACGETVYTQMLIVHEKRGQVV